MHYVYVYLDPRYAGRWEYKDKTFNFKPFYVGEGKGNRILTHLSSYSLKQKSIKSSILKSIIEEKLSPIFFKIYENLSKEEAIKIEIDFINHFGRQDKGTGILGNHTDGGIGWHKTVSFKQRPYKKFYKYSLDGCFQGSFTTKELLLQGIKSNNISTSIKRNGTHANCIWSYVFLGDKILPTIKYKQPYGFSKQEKVDIASLYKNGNDVKIIAKQLNTTREKVAKELKNQNLYKVKRNFQ